MTITATCIIYFLPMKLYFWLKIQQQVNYFLTLLLETLLIKISLQEELLSAQVLWVAEYQNMYTVEEERR